MKILLVDDEVELTTALSERLQIRGFDTTCASSGEEALGLAREQTFDVAILDVKMPGISGIKLMKALHEMHPSLQFIFVTGHGSEADFEECSRMGLCETIIKPIKIDTLVEQIKRAAKTRSEG